MDGFSQQFTFRGRPGDAADSRAEVDETAKDWDGAVGDGGEERFAWLARTIETEIIPRLMLAHKAVPAAPAVALTLEEVPSAAEVVEFTRLILSPDADVVSSYVEAMRVRGIGLESFCLDLLAPAARRLGELWCADLCEFTDVTVALGRLQQVMHEFSRVFRDEVGYTSAGKKAMFLPAAGEQHTFGLVMLTEFFTHAGWNVWSDPPRSAKHLRSLLHREWFDLIGFSVGCEGRLDDLAMEIRSVREASCNPALCVMVGGPIFTAQPGLAAVVGADGTATDGREALLHAERLLKLRGAPG